MPTSAASQKIDEALRASSAFHSMNPEEARRLRSDLLRVMDVLTDEHPRAAGMDDSEAQDQADKLSGRSGEAAAAYMSELKNAIGFGSFVKELITNVYDAIVHSSISQMEAYQKLLEDVLKPVGDFANERITDVQANNFAMSMMPSAFSMGSDGKLKAQGGSSVDLTKLGMPGMSVNPRSEMQKITNAAKLEMARQRQQLLATMVMMGINRIVVTDGEINAKMNIHVDTADILHRSHSAGRQKGGGGHIELGGTATATPNASGNASSGVLFASTRTTTDENASDAHLNAQANLSGHVKLQFKSETMPLDRFADGLSQTMLGKRAAPPVKAAGSAKGSESSDEYMGESPDATVQSYGGRGRGGWFRGSRGTAGAPWPTTVTWSGHGHAPALTSPRGR